MIYRFEVAKSKDIDFSKLQDFLQRGWKVVRVGAAEISAPEMGWKEDLYRSCPSGPWTSCP